MKNKSKVIDIREETYADSSTADLRPSSQTPEPEGDHAGREIRSDDSRQPVAASERPREHGGPRGPEPTRYGDWERNGRCSDF